LFELVRRRAGEVRSWEIDWRPERLSASFHGRDLFAPVAAMLARGASVPGRLVTSEADRRPDWPDDLAEIVYVDHYGNVLTGMRAVVVPRAVELEANGRPLRRAKTFSDLPPGTAFWYENSNGLVEIAVNQGRADRDLGLTVGTEITICI
jgi:S-adenosylmethionine hydrolase